MSCSQRCAALVFVLALTTGASGQSDRIQLSTGEVLAVRVLQITETTVRFEHPVLGEISAPVSAVTILAREESGAQRVEAPPPPAAVPPEPPPPPAEAAPPPPPEWAFKLTLAAAASDGNSENANITSLFTATRATARARLVFDAGAFFSQSDDVTSETRFTSGVRNDWLNPDSKWFSFAQARYDFDDYQSWQHRVSGHVGVGFRLLQPPAWTLNLLGGVGAVKEFESPNEDVRPEGLVGVEGAWDIAEKHKLTFNSTAFPELEEFGEFRWVNNAGWSLLLDEKNKLSLSAGVTHEYQSQVAAGREKNDVRVFAGLQLDF